MRRRLRLARGSGDCAGVCGSLPCRGGKLACCSGRCAGVGGSLPMFGKLACGPGRCAGIGGRDRARTRLGLFRNGASGYRVSQWRMRLVRFAMAQAGAYACKHRHTHILA